MKAVDIFIDIFKRVPLPMRWKTTLVILLLFAAGGVVDRNQKFKIACFATQGIWCPDNTKQLEKQEVLKLMTEIKVSQDSTRDDVKQMKKAINLLARYTGNGDRIKRDLQPKKEPDIFAVTKR